MKQIQTEINNKTIEYINEESSNFTFVDNCLKKLHHDRDLSSLLVGKLLKGANKFLELYREMDLEETKTT